MKKLLVLLISACLALAVAACGDDDDDDGGGGGRHDDRADRHRRGATKAAAGGGEAVTVDIQDIEFDPHDVTVKAGSTVTWTNTTSVAHTRHRRTAVRARTSIRATSNQGDTFEQTFDRRATVDYVCTIHPARPGRSRSTSSGCRAR